MKKLLLLFVALCATFVSCDKDDDKFEGNTSAFAGTTWECVEEYTDVDLDDVETKCKDIITIKFEKAAKFVSNYIAYENGKEVDRSSMEGQYSVDGNKLTLKSTLDGVESVAVGTINGKQFSYTIEDEEDGPYTFTFKLK